MSEDLSFFEIRPVLSKIADLGRELVLVGGQAVNFWASHYEQNAPLLEAEGPFTSKDIDFCGDTNAVRGCATRLRGTARVPSLDDATPNTGLVDFVDESGVPRTLDIVGSPFGLDAQEVHETALPVDLLDDEGKPTGVSFYVMHPVLCMESRVHNVSGLPGYDTDHGRRQVRASIFIVREFLRDILDRRIEAENPIRHVLNLNKRVFRFCMHAHNAKKLYRTHSIDPANALLNDGRLPAAFHEKGWPQMQAKLASRSRGATG